MTTQCRKRIGPEINIRAILNTSKIGVIFDSKIDSGISENHICLFDMLRDSFATQ